MSWQLSVDVEYRVSNVDCEEIGLLKPCHCICIGILTCQSNHRYLTADPFQTNRPKFKAILYIANYLYRT